MKTEIEFATAYVDQAVMALGRGELSVEDAAMAKWWCTERQGARVIAAYSCTAAMATCSSIQSLAPMPTLA